MSSSSSDVDLINDNPKGRELLEQALYRYKIAFAAIAQKSGATARYASQHSVLWGALGQKGFSGALWLGVCAGLSIEWLKARARGRDFLTELLTVRNAVFSEPNTIGSTQRSFGNRVEASHRQQGNVAAALTGYMRPAGEPVSVKYAYIDLPAALRPGAYVYISTGTHAMAAQVSADGQKIDFYDPNVGEMNGAKIDAVGTYLKEAQAATMKALGKSVWWNLRNKTVSVRNFT